MHISKHKKPGPVIVKIAFTQILKNYKERGARYSNYTW